jgi:hypothetical protein
MVVVQPTGVRILVTRRAVCRCGVSPSAYSGQQRVCPSAGGWSKTTMISRNRGVLRRCVNAGAIRIQISGDCVERPRATSNSGALATRGNADIERLTRKCHRRRYDRSVSGPCQTGQSCASRGNFSQHRVCIIVPDTAWTTVKW